MEQHMKRQKHLAIKPLALVLEMLHVDKLRGGMQLENLVELQQRFVLH